MTPHGHPAESVRAQRGYCRIWLDDGSSQSIELAAFAVVRDAADAARQVRADRARAEEEGAARGDGLAAVPTVPQALRYADLEQAAAL